MNQQSTSTFRICPIVAMLFAGFLLTGCTGSAPKMTSSSGPERFEFSLTKENYQDFLDFRIYDESSLHQANIQVSCQGVLSYAYYENVRITLLFTAVGVDYSGGPEVTRTGTETIKLNAAGNYSHIYTYEYIPEDIEPAFTRDSFYGYATSMTLENISGRVLFFM